MSRLERLVNLAAALSHTRTPLTFRQIRSRVPGYAEGEAGRRAFERDKDQLRDLGFDLRPEAGPEDEVGYRLRPEDWTMGPLDLRPDEAAALSLAASVARLEGDGPGPRLASGLGPELREPSQARVGARLGTASPLHAAVSDAVGRHRTLRFRYLPARGTADERQVEPFGVVLRNGHWYVVGRDLSRDGLRAFRLDRIEGEVEAGEPSSFTPPPDFDPASAVPSEPWASADETTVVRLQLDADVAWWARAQLGEHRLVEERPDGTLVVDLDVAIPERFVAFVASLLDAAEILSPPHLRAALVAHAQSLTGPAAGRPHNVKRA